MLVLITGASCSGKTSFAHSFSQGSPLQLDRYDQVEALLPELSDSKWQTGRQLVVEGMLSGHPAAALHLLQQCDCVIVLQAPVRVRFRRALQRDRAVGCIRFLRNEIAWRRHCAPLLRSPDLTVPVRYVTWHPEDAAGS